jgi:transcriptional regulator with XRE-family HTH domain
MKRTRKPIWVWDDDQFRARCRVAAARKGISVEDMCEQAGVDRTYLNKLSTQGRRIDAVIALAQVAEVSLSWLAGVEESPDLFDDSEAARLSAVAGVAAQLYGAIRLQGFDTDAGAIVRAVMDVVGRRMIKPTKQNCLPPLPAEVEAAEVPIAPDCAEETRPHQTSRRRSKVP